MPPRSGAPPQITFCLEYPASNRPASLPPPERQMPGSERSKAPIRRNDEPANHRRPRFRRERRRAASRPAPAARIRREKPSASNLPASNYSASNHPVPTSARAAGTGQRAQQGAYSEERRACKPPPPPFPTRAPPRSESHGACRPSASNTPSPRTALPRTNSSRTVSSPDLRQGGRCRAASAAKRLFGGTTSLQTTAAPVSDESAAAQRVARYLPPVRLEHSFSTNRPASNQLVSDRLVSRPPPGRQVPGSERSKAPIRRNDEPANHRRPRFRRERRRAASRTVPAAHPPRTRLLEPSRLPASARAAGAGQRAQQGAYSEERRACKPPPPLFPTRAPPRSESHGACRPSASNTPPRTVRPLFIFHAPPHTAALFHSSRRTAASPSAGWPRAHPPP